jgi:hypothetical protein
MPNKAPGNSILRGQALTLNPSTLIPLTQLIYTCSEFDSVSFVEVLSAGGAAPVVTSFHVAGTPSMRVISKRAIREFWTRHPESQRALQDW